MSYHSLCVLVRFIVHGSVYYVETLCGEFKSSKMPDNDIN